ncbi:DUF2934 domain-containing protein [Pseudomonas sp. ADAK18]|uniref:DUF2934 domain-containing protein n=1 Tax=Pseudomonas sp. ADAK18 TaxID=2730848 RepID=UPI00146398B8|nr:DUF2934 domain-containing protein [Pseudomonas sp. ADAK18]QJI29184.1 DUF2934 domain-containing protein [Pseudomonas sp. ADAK18]
MSTEDKRVREFAYQIWESEGKPEGQEDRHWEMARKLAEAEALTPSKPKTAAKPKAKPKAAAPAKAATVEKPAAKPKPKAPRKPAN